MVVARWTMLRGSPFNWSHPYQGSDYHRLTKPMNSAFCEFLPLLTVKSCDWLSDLPALWQQEVQVSLIAAKEVCFTLNWRLSLSLSFSLFKALVALSNSSQIPQSLQLLFSLKFLSLRTITQAMSTCIPSKITRGESLSSCTAIAGQESVCY